MVAFEGAAIVIWLFWLDLGQQHWRAAYAARWSHNWIRVRGCRVKSRHNKLPYAGGSITELSAINARRRAAVDGRTLCAQIERIANLLV